MNSSVKIEELDSTLSSLSLDPNCTKKSLLKWVPDTQGFQALKMTGNHWHTIGFPRNGSIFVHPEEAVFIVASKQALYQISEDGEWSDSVESLVKFVMPSLVSPTFLRVFLSLRKLGYIVWRSDNPYILNAEQNLNGHAEFMVYKPNSKFQKKQLSGFLFPLKLVPVDSTASRFLSGLVLPQKTAYAMYDETGQVYITLMDITDKFTCT